MKRICGLLLAACLVLGLCACGQKAPEGPTWQEQYDLGVKYLSEGNYEEAIIAFTAAIEIDPKRPEAYIGLADVYTAQGDLDKAAEILNQALDTIGENDALRAALEALSASGSPETAPEIPAVLQPTASGNGYGWGMTEYEDTSYLVLTENAAAALQPLISAGLSGDPDAALAAFQGVTPEQFRTDFSGLVTSGQGPALYDYDGGSALFFWTVWNGDLIGCDINSSPGYSFVILEYRAAAGTGFSARWLFDGNDSFSYYCGTMSGWLYNGAFTGVQWQWENGALVYDYQCEGGAADELLQGAYTLNTWREGNGKDSLKFKNVIKRYVFEAGHLTNAWTDPETGEAYCMMREWVSAEGDIVQAGGSSGDEEIMSVVTYVISELPMG